MENADGSRHDANGQDSTGSYSNLHGHPPEGAAAEPIEFGPPRRGGERPTFGKYDIVERLGKGAQGAVYLAYDTELKKLFALKFLLSLSSLTQDARNRFAREAQVGAHIESERVAKVYECDFSSQYPHIVMEYVPGGSLAERLEDSRLEIPEIETIAIDVASGLADLHENGIVHRDIKPDNLRISGGNRAKVLDLGIARATAPEDGIKPTFETTAGRILGTIPYMSPEQARGESVEKHSDVYSFGAVLFEMIAGRRLIRSKSGELPALLALVANPLVPSISSLRPGCPNGLEAICMKCLKKSPAERYPSATELLDDLTRLEDKRPVSAQRQPIRWWLDRHRKAVQVAKFSIPAGVFVIAALIYLTIRETKTIPEQRQQLAGQQDKIVRYGERLVEIDTVRKELQVKLDDEKRRGSELAIAAADFTRRTSPLIARNREIKQVSDKLKGLLTQFEVDFGVERLGPVEDFQLRLARATVAVAERRYDDALKLVSEDDATVPHDANEAQVKLAVRANNVRGSALAGLRRWEPALACYSRILQLQPSNLVARQQYATHLFLLRRLPEAATEFDKVLTGFTALVDKNRLVAHEPDLAWGYSSRGNLRRMVGQLPLALQDHEKAVAFFTRLVEDERCRELESDLAWAINNRANTLKDQGRLDEALPDYDRAVGIYSKLVDRDGRTECEEGLARLLTNRANLLVDLRKPGRALKDYTKAIAITTRLVHEEGRTELEPDLGWMLNGRGNTLDILRKYDEAARELAAALRIYTRLVKTEKRSEYERDRAWILTNQAVTEYHTKKFKESIRDYDEAIDIFRRLIREEKRSELSSNLAKVLGDRGNAHFMNDNLTAAIHDHNEAVDIYSQLVQEDKRLDLEPKLAMALNNRGIVLRRQKKLDAALVDHNRAVEILKRLIEKEGQSYLTDQLVDCLSRRNQLLQERGELERASQDRDEAIRLLTSLIDNEGRADLLPELAEYSSSLAGYLLDLGKHEQSRKDLDRAITTYTRLIREEHRKDLEPALAQALNRRGVAIRLLRGKVADCMKDHDDAITIYTRLVEEEGRGGLNHDLAGALNNRGLALLAIKEYPKAIQDFSRAMTIFTELGKREGEPSLDNQQATTLCWRGQCYLNSDKLAECIQDLTRAEALLTRLKQQGYKAAANNLAGCLNDRAVAFGRQAKLAAAIEDFGRVVEIRRDQVQAEKGEEWSARLAAALLNRAIAFEKQRKVKEALTDVEEAIAIYSRLVEAGRSEFERPLIGARKFRVDLKEAKPTDK